MSRAVDAAIERCQPGVRLKVVEHTYRPQLVGTVRTIVRRDPLSPRLMETVDDGQEGAMELAGTNLEWLDVDTIRYPIFNRRRSNGTRHTITLRFLPAAR